MAGGEGLRLQSAYRERLADHHTPVSVLRALVAPGQAGALLESVEGGERWGRFSLVLADPILTLRLRRDGLTLGWPDGRCDRREGAPLACLEAALPSPLPGATAAIEAAVVGVLGWDLARTFEPIGEGPPPLHPDLPLGAFFLPGVSVAFDNLRHVVRLGVHRLLAPGKCPAGEGWATEGLDALEARLAAGRVPAPLLPLASAGVAKPGAAGFASRTDPRALAEAIAEARERILAGECIQVVLARTFEGPAQAPPFEVYRQLRALNPSPYLTYLALPERPGAPAWIEIAGSSPEVLVRREGPRAIVRPIAGTRPRGRDEVEDRALEAELLADPKERAEHVMLVDLGRNDLGRVARPGAVRVRTQAQVERYSHVMHLVSEVEADLRPEVGLAELIAATFPAGTLSGAPKVRAMQIIDALEPPGRGLYGGAVGLIGPDARVDLAISIRTLVQFDGRQWIGAGAGVVADSVPEREVEETLHKASALLRAVQAVRSRSAS